MKRPRASRAKRITPTHELKQSVYSFCVNRTLDPKSSPLYEDGDFTNFDALNALYLDMTTRFNIKEPYHFNTPAKGLDDRLLSFMNGLVCIYNSNCGGNEQPTKAMMITVQRGTELLKEVEKTYRVHYEIESQRLIDIKASLQQEYGVAIGKKDPATENTVNFMQFRMNKQSLPYTGNAGRIGILEDQLLKESAIIEDIASLAKAAAECGLYEKTPNKISKG